MTSMQHPRLKHLAKLFAILTITIACAFVSDRYRFVSDWTRDAEHTLSAASQTMVERLPGQLMVTAYLPQSHPARQQFERLVALYQRYHPDIVSTLIDPAKSPQKVRAQNIRDGEVVVEYGGREERVQKYTEKAFTAALARLARNDERWLVFLSGHGERSPVREANHDISAFAEVLRARGMKIQELNAAETNTLPDNTAVVIVAAPQVPYLPSEIAVLKRYIESGGNLLWLSEPEEPAAMSALAHLLGVKKLPGILVDPASLASGLDNPAILVASRYADHPALSTFNLTTLLVYAGAFIAHGQSDWTVSNLILSNDKAWAEKQKLEGNVAFDENQDLAGPLPLALALERRIAQTEQRVIVMGDGDFLSNTYLQNGGNQDLGVRLLEWLATDDDLVDVPSRVAIDTTLTLALWQQAVIGFGFLFLLPGALAVNGFRIWSRRRRA